MLQIGGLVIQKVKKQNIIKEFVANQSQIKTFKLFSFFFLLYCYFIVFLY